MTDALVSALPPPPPHAVTITEQASMRTPLSRTDPSLRVVSQAREGGIDAGRDRGRTPLSNKPATWSSIPADDRDQRCHLMRSGLYGLDDRRVWSTVPSLTPTALQAVSFQHVRSVGCFELAGTLDERDHKGPDLCQCSCVDGCGLE